MKRSETSSAQPFLDRGSATREGEELDLERLGPYLRKALGQHGELRVEQFPSGYSNLTYLLRLGDLELVLRRPPFGNRVASAHDMGREYQVLSALAPVYALAPKPYLYCEDQEVLGAPFYVMERRRGVILRRQLPSGLELPPEQAAGLCRSFVAGLAQLHHLDFRAVGLEAMDRGAGYARRQVEGWSERYERSRTHDWEAMEQVSRCLRDELPDSALNELPGRALVHNDYKYDNLVLDPEDLTRIIGLLDWEMATVGHPWMDLGCALAYWVESEDPLHLRQAAFGPTWMQGSLSRRELVTLYGEQSGREVADPAFYYAFGLFRLAVIVQQIYARFARGATRDPRFAELHGMVRLLGERAASVIDRGSL